MRRSRLRVAGITISLDSPDPALALSGAASMAGFLVSGGDPDLALAAGWGHLGEEPGGATVFDAGGLWRLEAEGEHWRFSFTSPALGPVPYKVARVSRDFTDGRVILHRPYFAPDRPVNPLEYPLDELLVTTLLARGRGVEVHACGVVDGPRGLLFVGPSGAGKTTMARLWQGQPGVVILSDDRIVLRHAPEAHSRARVEMHGTPWHGEGALAAAACAPLAAIFFLRHGPTNRAAPLARAEASARLLAASFAPFYSAPGLDFTLGFLDSLTRDIPCHELTFVPDRSVVASLRDRH